MPFYGIRPIEEIYKLPVRQNDDLIVEYKQEVLFDTNYVALLCQYLFDNGFAIARHDIIFENKVYFELTDRGRKLKECGSVESFNAYELAYKNEAEMVKRREINLYRISLGLLISTAAAALYYLMEILNHWFAIYPSCH